MNATSMTTVILCGGKSTRMAPYNDDVIPKCLLPVALDGEGRMVPCLGRLIEMCMDAEIQKIRVVCNEDNVRSIENYVTKNIEWNIQFCVQILPEQGGAIQAALPIYDEHILILDGDGFYDNIHTIRDMVRIYNGIPLVSVMHVERFDKYAMVEVEEGRVVWLFEKPKTWTGSMLAKGGILIAPRDLIRGYSTTDLCRCLRPYAHPIGFFTDIGTWDEYIPHLRMVMNA